MNTPPPKLGKRERETPPSQMATPIVLPPSQMATPILLPPSQQPTPIVQIPKKPRTIPGTNLRNALEEEQHSDYLRQRLDELYSRNSDNSNSDYDDRVEETAKMVFRLPKKAANNRGNAQKNIEKRH